MIPIRTDSPIDRVPWANYVLIALNVTLFAAFDWFGRTGLAELKQQLMLQAHAPRLYQFFSYQFLHGDLPHLLGNMLFLWIFGNSVNGKMGHVVYVLFYLACGVFAGVGYAAGNDAPMLGASGSIAGVTTAFVVLFPRAHVTFLYWFLVIGFFELPSMLVIVFKIILWDNVLAPRLGSGMGNVAYAAHLSGYGFGFALALVMLAVRALPRDQFDLLAIARRWYQRRSFAEAMREPEAAARARYGRVARPIVVTQTGTPPADPRQQQIESLREQIAESLDRHDLTGAAELYLQLVGLDPTQVLPRQQQLDVANQLMTLQRFAEAACAYEKYLSHYPKAEHADQVRLLLGILYARYLEQYEPACRHLAEALPRLVDERQRQACRHWLEVASSSAQDPDPSRS